jgi:hypothetical protein
MKSSVIKYLLVLTVLAPLLGGCGGDDDDEDVSVPPIDGGNEPDPNSVSTIFGLSADDEPVEIEDPDALFTDLETNFGIASDDPREPGEVLDLSEEI